MKAQHRIGAVLAVVAGSVVIGALPAMAAPAAAGTPAPTVVTVGNQDQDAAVRAYWTPERMRDAIPADVDVSNSPADAGQEQADTNAVPHAPVVIPPSPAKSDRPFAAQDYSFNTVGKLFVTKNGVNSSCSGVVVAGSNNRNLVATAAHCLSNNNGVASNGLFVPGYSNGSLPNGSFSLRSFTLTAGYNPSTGNQHDAAFMVVGTNSSGQSVGSAVGENGLAFFSSPAQTVTQAGYGIPNGSTEVQSDCAGVQSFADPSDSTRIASNCVFAPGASGGPFFVQTSPNVYATVIAVMRGSAGGGAREVGPLFQGAELAAYQDAIKAS